MTTREKIVVAVAGVVIAGGGIAYVKPRIGPPVDSEVTAATAADLASVESSRQQLAACRLTDSERYVLETAQLAWTSRPPAKSEAKDANPPPSSGSTNFIYTGFVNMGAERFAIINGREYRRGDVVKDSAALVEAIDADHVVLVLGNGGKRENLPFQKPVLKGEKP